MVSGDGVQTTKAVGDKIGIQKSLGGQMPRDKSRFIIKLQQKGYRVAMVGDGINDAPVVGGTISPQADDDADTIAIYDSTATAHRKMTRANFLSGVGGTATLDNATSLVAFATGGETNATVLFAGFNEVAICATAGDSCKLPTAADKLFVIVMNNGAEAMDLFPRSGVQINALGTGNAASIASG